MNKNQTAKAALFQMLENMPVLIEYSKLEVMLMREKYLALVKAGFSEQQAIDLLRPKA